MVYKVYHAATGSWYLWVVMNVADQLPAVDLQGPPTGAQRLYAIAFDLLIEQPRTHYSATSPNNAYAEIRALLEDEGFAWRQGSLGVFSERERARPQLQRVVEIDRAAAPWLAGFGRHLRAIRAPL